MERPLTRAEMASVIFKVFSWYDLQLASDVLDKAGQSIPDLNNYAMEDGRRGPIIKCYALEIITGTDSQGTFNGEADMTRAQAGSDAVPSGGCPRGSGKWYTARPDWRKRVKLILPISRDN